MTRCAKCGKESPDQARFCRFCGGTLAFGVEEAVSADPTVTPEQRALRLLEEAHRLSEQGRILAAIQTGQQAIAINPQSTSAHSLLGTLYERQGDREKAIREYEQVLTLSPESTVERRRLNELMGVPAAREPVTVSPRQARMAITGAFVVLVLVVIGAATLRRSPESPGASKVTSRRTGASGGEAVTFAEQTPMLPSPGRTFVPTATFPAAPPVRQPTWRVQTAPGPAPATGRGTYLGPGTYLLPSSGGEQYYAGERTVQAPPMLGAQPYRGTPVVGGGGAWTGTPGGGTSTQVAREYYLQGDYRRAATTYQTYLNQNPGAGGAPREELAWVYMQMGNRSQAQQEYQNALSSYQTDLERGHNTEAARHGARTCQSAIKALEAQ